MKFRPMLFLTICTIAGLVVLCMLGTWQWNRYQEKLALPDKLPADALVALELQPADTPMQFVYTTYNGESLWRSFQLGYGCITRPDGEKTCDQAVFVDRALLSALDPDEIAYEPSRKPISGSNFRIVPSGQHSMISPTDSPETARWYVASSAAMAKALLFEDPDAALLAEPVTIDRIRNTPNGVETSPIENPFANPAHLDDLPPQRHLGYALTWFGLAAALIGVYVALHMARGALVFGRGKPNDTV